MKFKFFILITCLFSPKVFSKKQATSAQKAVQEDAPSEKKVSKDVDKFNAQIDEIGHLLSVESTTKNSSQLKKLQDRLSIIKKDAAARNVETIIAVETIQSLEATILTYLTATGTSDRYNSPKRKRETRKLRA